MAASRPKKKLTSAEAWAEATDRVRARWGNPGPVDEGAGEGDLPTDDRAFWDEVEREAVALGGNPAG